MKSSPLDKTAPHRPQLPTSDSQYPISPQMGGTLHGEETIEYTPIDVSDARYIYDELRDSLSYLRKRINAEQSLLDITPKDNYALKKDCLIKIIMYKADLIATENQFKSVKKWFDKNNLPYQ